jgi:DNA-binding transcriptional LysR family regulator
MDTRKLEYLEAVYRLRNFTKAANEQFVSQSSLSEAILRLEEEMGAKLINRDVKPIEFTPSGEVFMKYVYPLLNIVRTAREEVALLRCDISAADASANAAYTHAGFHCFGEANGMRAMLYTREDFEQGR